MFTAQAQLFTEATRAADPAAPVPSCPGWSFADLTRHVGRFLENVTRYLRAGSRVELRPLPERAGDPLADLDEQLAAATAALRDTPGNRPLWTPSPAAPDLAWVWHRRAAHELNLRRWDAQAALRTLAPTDREQAADAIDELLGTLLAIRLTFDSPPKWTGSAMVVCTDGPQRWHVELRPGEIPAVRLAADGEDADATLSGRTSNLLYQLWSRMNLTGDGDAAVLRELRAR